MFKYLALASLVPKETQSINLERSEYTPKGLALAQTLAENHVK